MFRRWLPGPFEPLPPRQGQAFTTDDVDVPTPPPPQVSVSREQHLHLQQQEIARLKADLADLQGEAAAALQERDAVRVSHLQEIARLKADCAHLQEESDVERRQSQQELARARERLSVLETEALQFQATLQERRAAEQAYIEQLSRLEEQQEEFLACSKAHEELQSQNRELTVTVFQLRQDNESLLVENRGLQDIALQGKTAAALQDRSLQEVLEALEKRDTVHASHLQEIARLKADCQQSDAERKQAQQELSRARERLFVLETEALQFQATLQESLKSAKEQASGSMERAEDELNRTRTGLATLEAELVQANKALEKRDTVHASHLHEIARLKADCQQSDAERKQAQQELSRARDRLFVLETEALQFQATLQERRATEQAYIEQFNRLEERQEEFLACSKAHEKLQSQNRELASTVLRLRQDNESLLDENRGLQESLESAKEQASGSMERAEDKLDRTRTTLATLETELVQVNKALEERDEVHALHLQEIAQLKANCRHLQEESDIERKQSEQELSRARERLFVLETEALQFQATLQERKAAEQKYIEHFARLEEQQQDFLACSKAHDELQAQVRELATTVLQLRQDNEALLVDNHGLQESLESAKAQASGSMERSEDELNRTRTALATLETELVQANKAVEERDALHASHLQEIARLKADCQHLQEEADIERKQSQQELSRARERLSVLETEALQFQATLQERRAAEQAYIEQFTRLEVQQEEFLACSKAYEELQSQNRELTSTILQLREGKESLLGEKRGLQESLERAKEQASGSMERAEDELKRTRTALAALEAELVQVNKERRATEQEHIEQIARLEERQEEFLACSKAQEQLQSQNQELTSTVLQLRQDNGSLLDEKQSLQESLESAKEQASGSMERAEDELNRTRATLETLETELVQVNKALEERDEVHASHLQEIARLKADCQHLQEESDAEKKQTQQELSRARERLSALETEALQFQATLQERRAAEQTYIEQLTRLEEQQEEFLVYSKAHEELQSQNRELTITVLQLRQDNESLLVENRGLQESVALFEEDLEKVSDRNAQLLGHTNPKQKIRYTLKLKEEKMQLRAELNRLRSRVLQLEGTKHCDSLFEAALVGDASSITSITAH